MTDEEKKEAPAPINVVLYARSEANSNWFPIFSGNDADEGVMDEAASHKHEKLITARQAGAPRPEFKIVREQNGKEIKG